jgi:hypothetical protein
LNATVAQCGRIAGKARKENTKARAERSSRRTKEKEGHKGKCGRERNKDLNLVMEGRQY